MIRRSLIWLPGLVAFALLLVRGKVFRTGTIAEIQQDEKVRALYLGNTHA